MDGPWTGEHHPAGAEGAFKDDAPAEHSAHVERAVVDLLIQRAEGEGPGGSGRRPMEGCDIVAAVDFLRRPSVLPSRSGVQWTT